MFRARPALCCLVPLGLLLGGGPAQAAAPPPLQPIETVGDLPIPSALALEGGTLMPDAQHALVWGVVGGARQVGVMRLDGTGFTCISCGVVSQALDPDAFDDGRRILVSGAEKAAADPLGAVGGGGGLGDLQYTVIECAPSVADCRGRRALPLDFPTDSLSQGVQNREVATSPDGRFVKWNEVRATQGEVMVMGRLLRSDRGYTVADPVVLNERWTPSTATGLADGGRFHESGGGSSGRSFWDGGRTLKYNATTTSLNYDLFELDLATGARRRLTTDDDYNEMSDASPDGRWLSYASARGLHRMDVFTQLHRPPFLDVLTFGMLGRIALFNNRRCMKERWLMDRGGQRGRYGGQPVVTEDGWVIRGWRWFPDGRRALLEEERIPNETQPTDPRRRIRLRIVRFPALRPAAPRPTVPIDPAALARWGAPYATYETLAAQPRATVVAGPRGGTATLTFLGVFAGGVFSVRYHGWTEDGRTFLDGTESYATAGASPDAAWSADLAEHGAHTGTLRGDVELLPQNRFRADVHSTVDGETHDGVPTQADCPGVHQPPLTVTARRLPGGRRLRLRVTARVPEDPVARPVIRARVRVGRRGAWTDARGVARLTASHGADEVTATAPGFRAASARLR